MHSARVSFLAGTALALILAINATASAAPAANSEAPPPPRGYSTPGSMPKPSSAFPDDDGLRFRGPIQANDSAPVAHRPTSTPLAPAPIAPHTATESSPAKAAPVKAAIETPAPATRPVPSVIHRDTASSASASTSSAHSAPPSAPRQEPPATASHDAPPVSATAVEQPPASVVRQAPPAPAAVQPPTVRPVAAAPAEAPGAVFTDSQIGDKIRELIAGKQFDRLIARKADRDAIAALYQKTRNFQPLWVAQGGASERTRDVLDYFKTIDADGLDPRDYPAPRFSAASAEGQAEAELKFTETVLTYSRHALNGRVHFTRVSPNIDYKLTFEADDVLKKVATSNDLPKTLQSFNPQQPAYEALKAKLAELRNEPEQDATARIGKGPVLKYFRDRNKREYITNDARVPLLRERLGLPAESNTAYNLALANAVAKFQKAHGIQVTGQFNQPTIDALNPPNRARQIEAILATMERWRWMPRNLGPTHIVLNIPDYNLRVYHNGEKVWQTKVVVGKPDHQTPLLTETMKYITVNPTWNVPQSIIYNELLPIYETSDPQIFERQGLKVERDRDGSIRVFQPPGERNALGQIRFNFPNKFLVYQHDTPEKYYFAQDKRAYSHGCMRVQDPLKYAEVLLSYASPKSGYTVPSLQRMIGGQEQQLDFHTPLPVHITYQTAFVDEAGKLQFRDDIYGLDAKLMSILNGKERAVADTAIERPADPNFKPSPEAAMKLKSVARGGGSPPFALFDHLFR